jgi:hypothetical protein
LSEKDKLALLDLARTLQDMSTSEAQPAAAVSRP